MSSVVVRENFFNGIEAQPRRDTYRYGSFSFDGEEEDPYFVTHTKPEGLDIVKKRADEFVKIQKGLGRKVVLVTSGGSTVPLEVQLIATAMKVLKIESNGQIHR